jgi:menaquinone-dependent protoporphyrinogen IX oxidase
MITITVEEKYKRYITNMNRAMKRYRAKIKADPVKYEASKERARDYMTKYREDIKADPVALEEFRERQRENQKRYRERMRKVAEELKNKVVVNSGGNQQ